jgi:hypothetical protein
LGTPVSIASTNWRATTRSFVEVAANTGDYIRAGISSLGAAYFEFGAQRGSHGESLPLPTSSIGDSRIARQKGASHVRRGWNVSQYDRNLFSSLDDDDNMGNAGQFKIGVERDGDWRWVRVWPASSKIVSRA